MRPVALLRGESAPVLVCVPLDSSHIPEPADGTGLPEGISRGAGSPNPLNTGSLRSCEKKTNSTNYLPISKQTFVKKLYQIPLYQINSSGHNPLPIKQHQSSGVEPFLKWFHFLSQKHLSRTFLSGGIVSEFKARSSAQVAFNKLLIGSEEECLLFSCVFVFTL